MISVHRNGIIVWWLTAMEKWWVLWTRIINDYGHVDDGTPSFAISLYKEYRGKGIGTQMMVKMLELLKMQGV